ncbi:MAG: insulinase family protein, partial [Bacteroidota bacterium]
NPIPSIDVQLDFFRQMLPGIQLEEINQLAAAWITRENRVVVITGPEKEEAPLPNEQSVRELLAKMPNQSIQPYVDRFSDAPLMANIPTPGSISSEKTIAPLQVTEIQLSNQVRLLLKPTDFQNDEVLMRAYSVGGHSIYSDDLFIQANNAASIIDQSGIGTFDLTQLQKKLSGQTVGISPYISEFYEGMVGQAAPKDLESLFQLIHLYFTAPRQDADALKAYVDKEASIYENLLTDPQYFFYDQLSKIKSQNHPRRGYPTAEDIRKIDLKSVHKIYRDRFADASDFTFVFVGNFEDTQIKALAKTYLASLPTQDRNDQWKDIGVRFPKGQIKREFRKGQAQKALVDLTWHGPFEWNRQNRYDFYSMLAILRIKMRESMREDKGGVYGVRVGGSVSQIPQNSYQINISFNADPERVEELIQTAMQDIKKAQDIGAEEKDLDKVKETQKQQRIKSLKENGFWLRQLEAYYKNNTDPGGIGLEAYEVLVDSLNATAIKQAANQYFQEDRFIQVVLRPEKDE